MAIRSSIRVLSGILVVLSVAAIPVLTGCDGFIIPVCQANNDCTTTTTTTTGTSSSYRALVYTSSALSGAVSGATVGVAGLIPVASPIKPPTGAPTAVVATPAGDLLWVATSSGSIFSYTIGSNGSLQLGNNGQPVATVSSPAAMAMDRDGKSLFVASTAPARLNVFRVDAANGGLTPLAGAISLDPGTPRQVLVAPDNQHLFVALGTGGVDGFTLNASAGAIANQVHLASLRPANNSDTAIATDNSSRYLFLAESGAGIRVLTVGADGALTEIPGSPFASQAAAPSSLSVGTHGGTLYAADPVLQQINGYTIGSDGGLTGVSQVQFAPDTSPTALSAMAVGQYLVAVGKGGSGTEFRSGSTAPGQLDLVSRMAAR